MIISIHALREEGDAFWRTSVLGASISIHALREEGDALASRQQLASTGISIHALREEGDT